MRTGWTEEGEDKRREEVTSWPNRSPKAFIPWEVLQSVVCGSMVKNWLKKIKSLIRTFVDSCGDVTERRAGKGWAHPALASGTPWPAHGLRSTF